MLFIFKVLIFDILKLLPTQPYPIKLIYCSFEQQQKNLKTIKEPFGVHALATLSILFPCLPV